MRANIHVYYTYLWRVVQYICTYAITLYNTMLFVGPKSPYFLLLIASDMQSRTVRSSLASTTRHNSTTRISRCLLSAPRSTRLHVRIGSVPQAIRSVYCPALLSHEQTTYVSESRMWHTLKIAGDASCALPLYMMRTSHVLPRTRIERTIWLSLKP